MLINGAAFHASIERERERESSNVDKISTIILPSCMQLLLQLSWMFEEAEEHQLLQSEVSPGYLQTRYGVSRATSLRHAGGSFSEAVL